MEGIVDARVRHCRVERQRRVKRTGSCDRKLRGELQLDC